MPGGKLKRKSRARDKASTDDSGKTPALGRGTFGGGAKENQTTGKNLVDGRGRSDES